ncbi:hypothetical protein JCM19241_4895 [Vibrio ishigakensis]|uniref:Uncharacterized protein n=1 Tax=Vibrio ishigakensis TaxID=1481914 RepID=A0A0B8QEW7_9VIBR|nr:hypothetical protein JCM19241_4895 [Vibrio ishigakensis]
MEVKNARSNCKLFSFSQGLEQAPIKFYASSQIVDACLMLLCQF